ncbi:unnamed protein product (macronuclear) [Paramecium tetraurelia]|uniref:non-specific serine/threonine protein kinase n=1 Tax=Paramecium tetraurelia TaxID=5888 RepID=A0E147_PARTE|nr:uncharacterized protein GSPATT00022183001 [Paramecium tetraurelia]CAK89014.1 unnamed protein product [Paramecium tetraurelia]|eukprot:XP_001456411.1 hypothetical protein (macronuclear) [Paramecium tetraurelia strain d4-2]
MQLNYEILQEIYQSKKVRIEKVRSMQDNQTYIQKTYLQNKNEGLNAIKMLAQIKNQFVLQVIEYLENEEQQLVIIQEYCDQGDLKTFTLQHIGYKMQESIIWSLFLQMAYALLQLNELGIQHRVLIPENILLLVRTEGYQIRITDFHKSSRQTLCQLPCAAIYLPYEYFFEGQYTQKSHIWQIGHILYFMVSQKLLFPTTTLENQVKEQLRRGRIQINIPEVYSQGLNKLINVCLTIRENQRPNILQILRMKEVRDALARPYYEFSLDQRRHLMYWINSSETAISNPVQFTFNEFDLHSPRQIQKDVVIKKNFRNSKLPEIFQQNQHAFKSSTDRLPESDNIKTETKRKEDLYLQQQLLSKTYTNKYFQGVVKPISFHKKKQVINNTELPKFSIPYQKQLDPVFQNLLENKKQICDRWIGETEYMFLRSQIKFNKTDKLLSYLQQRHPKVDGSVILQQINDIAHLEDQRGFYKKC